jgi:predicted porin
VRYTFKYVGAAYASVTNSLATGMADGQHASGTFVDAGVLYPVTPSFFVSPSLTWGKVIGSPYIQTNLLLDYFLSKRTDVYVGAWYQKSMSEGRTAGLADISSVVGLNAGNSSTDKQLAFRVGIRTKF